MYLIDFGNKSVAFYEALYEGWLLGSHLDQSRGPLNNPQWSWMNTVSEAEITKQFRNIGVVLPCGRKTATGDPALTLKSGGPYHMELTQDQFQMIVRRFQLVPWAVARLPEVVEHFKRLASIQETKNA